MFRRYFRNGGIPNSGPVHTEDIWELEDSPIKDVSDRGRIPPYSRYLIDGGIPIQDTCDSWWILPYKKYLRDRGFPCSEDVWELEGLIIQEISESWMIPPTMKYLISERFLHTGDVWKLYDSPIQNISEGCRIPPYIQVWEMERSEISHQGQTVSLEVQPCFHPCQNCGWHAKNSGLFWKHHLEMHWIYLTGSLTSE